MASPRTGRPRGRPRKPKPPARPRGNQPYDFFRDPDRYAIALLDVLLADGAGSARDLSFAIAAWQVGIEAESPSGAKHPGLVATHWLTKRTIPGARAATLEGRAATLRQKQARKTIPTAQAEWRTTMASCFNIVFGARDRARAQAAVLERAATVGEQDFAWLVLCPMIGWSPDTFARFSADYAIHDTE